jgi:hypothetical protein
VRLRTQIEVFWLPAIFSGVKHASAFRISHFAFRVGISRPDSLRLSIEW